MVLLLLLLGSSRYLHQVDRSRISTLHKVQVKANFKCKYFDLNELLTISQVSKRSGVASSALRLHGQRRLILSGQLGSGHRRYPRAVLRRIAFIVFAQKIGLSLEEISAELAKLPHNRVPESSHWAKLSGEWSRRIDKRIAELERLRGAHPMHRLRVLISCPGAGSLTLVIAPRVAAPVPRYWLGDPPTE